MPALFKEAIASLEHIDQQNDALKKSTEDRRSQFGSKLLDAHDGMMEKMTAKKTADEQKRKSEVATRKTLKLEEAAAAAAFAEGDGQTREQSKPVVAKRKKKAKEDIFREFGNENQSSEAMYAVVAGVTVRRFNYKRFWNSELDLKRWTTSLGHNTRHVKLHLQSQEQSNPDFGADQAMLRTEHNSANRSRQSTNEAHSKNGMLVSTQIREMQRLIRPKEKAKPARKRVQPVAKDVASEPWAKEEEVEFDGKSDACSATQQESTPPESARGSDDGNHTPLSEAEGDNNKTGKRGNALAEGGKKQLKHPVVMPTTTALLLFKNADPFHAGDTVFVNRELTDMQQLFAFCGAACKPMVPPCTALLDSNLRPVRSLKDLKPGVPYLCKGMEPLDPPSCFQAMGFESGTALRNIHASMHNIRTQEEAKHRLPAPNVRKSSNSWMASSSTAFTTSRASASCCSFTSAPKGSPPWHSMEEQRPLQHLKEKWQPSNGLAHALSWSGTLQRNPRHSMYEHLKPLPLASRGPSTSMAASQPNMTI